MKSTSQHLFAQVPKAYIPRSSFRRNMTWKTAFDSGYLVPIYVDEALPGDTFNCKVTQFARLSSALSLPVMDNIYMDTFFFAVPIRLVWDHFQRAMGEQPNPGDTTDFLAPILEKNVLDNGIKIEEGSLSDYLGIPPGEWGNLKCSSLWHRAYNLIWNEFFRDENLCPRVTQKTDDGPDRVGDFKLLRRGKRHDYFTSSLPWVCKGPAAEIGIVGYAPVSGLDESGLMHPFVLSDSITTDGVKHKSALYRNGTSSSVSFTYQTPDDSEILAGDSIPVAGGIKISGGKYLGVEPDSLFANLSEASSVTINSLREAFAIQRQLERDARSGTRFTEILRANFGVVSPDARLQRPEYLGGGSYPLQVHSVAQTSATESGSLTPQGNLAAYSLGGGACGFVKSFVEHSLILGLACVRCDLTYQQGLHRMFSRRSRFDWYWPALHNLGEQAVLNKEIYLQGTDADDKPFGYQERWAEYRYGQSRITGKLRSTAKQSLDSWHLAQDFATLPGLNEDFISEHPPLDRILAVNDEPQIIYDSVIALNCVRPMGCYSVPGLIDHF